MLTIKEVLEDRDEFKYNKRGRQWDEDVAPIYKRILDGGVPFVVEMNGDKKYIQNKFSSIAAFIRNNHLEGVGLSIRNNKSGAVIYVFNKNEEQ